MTTSTRQKTSWLSRQSLRTRVGGILAISIFLLTGLLSGVIGLSSVNQLRARIGQSLATDASRMTDRINSEMAARGRELALLGALDPLRDLRDIQPQPASSVPLPTPPGALRVQSMLDGLKRSVPAYTWIGVTDPRGRVLAATDPATIGTDVSTRASFREGVRGRTQGAAPRASDEDLRALELSDAIRGVDGSVLGVIIAQLGWQWLQALSDTVLTPDEEGVVRSEMFVINNQDVVLLGPPGTHGQKLTLTAVSRARAGFLGWTVETWPDGEFLTGTNFASGKAPCPAPARRKCAGRSWCARSSRPHSRRPTRCSARSSRSGCCWRRFSPARAG